MCRDFFAGLLRRDLDGEVLRFAASLVMRSAAAGDGEVEVVDVDVRRRVGLNVGSWRVAGCCVCWGRADSGIRRKDIGSSLLFPRGAGWVVGSFGLGLERLRAAAAHERSVFRLDRKASSWWAAALYDGDRMF